MKVVVASFNRGKRRELEELLASLKWELVSLADWPEAAAPEESGATLLENARIKARSGLAISGLPAIADDTGLEVDALGGRPGIHSARWAGPDATDADNVRRLLAELATVPAERRGARFRTVCVACFPDGSECTAEGVLEGRIVERPRGANGFGYDPVFEASGLGRTLAELTPAEKNQFSHRARAIRELQRRLRLVRRERA